MPVRYTPPTPESLLPVAGIALGPAAGRIKNWQRDDVLLVTCTPGTVAAGVFTRNRFCAAPVTVCREHLAHQHKGGAPMRALVVNAGNANAGTGQPGLNAARQTCAAVAADDDKQAAPAPAPAPFVRGGEKVGRNDPCPCGSGKKYKKCHGAHG